MFSSEILTFLVSLGLLQLVPNCADEKERKACVCSGYANNWNRSFREKKGRRVFFCFPPSLPHSQKETKQKKKGCCLFFFVFKNNSSWKERGGGGEAKTKQKNGNGCLIPTCCCCCCWNEKGGSTWKENKIRLTSQSCDHFLGTDKENPNV